MPGLFEGPYCSWSKAQHTLETTLTEYFYQRDSRKPNLTSNSRDRDGKIMALTSALVPPTLFSVCNSAFFIHRMLVSQKSSHHACVKTLRYTRLTTAHNVHCLKRSRLKQEFTVLSIGTTSHTLSKTRKTARSFIFTWVAQSQINSKRERRQLRLHFETKDECDRNANRCVAV